MSETEIKRIFQKKFRALLADQNVSQREIARICHVSTSTVSTWFNGINIPRMGKIECLAQYFGLPKSYFIEDSDDEPPRSTIPPGFEPLPKMVQVPLIGSIACGSPILAEENIETYIGIPAAWRADFALTCHGDSMAPKICDGDIVCIRKQAQVNPGEIAAVRIGEEATLKHFYQTGDVVQLIAENASVCPPMVYQGEELNAIQIEGKAVGFCRGLG